MKIVMETRHALLLDLKQCSVHLMAVNLLKSKSAQNAALEHFGGAIADDWKGVSALVLNQ